MRIFWIFTFHILIWFVLTYLWFNCDKEFFLNFLSTQILPISATIIWFSISGIIFLITHLLSLDWNFEKTKEEIRDNIVFMGITFFIMFFFLLVSPSSFSNEIFKYSYYTTIVTSFLLQLFAVYEILRAIFLIKK